MASNESVTLVSNQDPHELATVMYSQGEFYMYFVC